MATDFDLASLLPTTGGPADLVFECTETAPAPVPAGEREVIGIISIVHGPDHNVVGFEDVTDYHIWPDRIVCHLKRAEHDYLIPNQLLGFVMAFWLEGRGVLALHASAVALYGRAVAFMSTQKGGKTSTAAWLARNGHPLVAEDLLAVSRREGEFWVSPGYPQMRMWPSEVQRFAGDAADLPLYHPSFDKRWVPVSSVGAFAEGPAPLAGIYLPERSDRQDVEIARLGAAEGLKAVMTGSYLADVVDAHRIHPGRLEALVDLVAAVPVCRLLYPTGFDRLPEVETALVAEVT